LSVSECDNQLYTKASYISVRNKSEVAIGPLCVTWFE